MIHNSQPLRMSLTRRRFLQSTLGGVVQATAPLGSLERA